MDVKSLVQKIKQSKKTKDYSLLIVFFIIFSVFAWFAIRPNLVTAVTLHTELDELREKDALYEQVIMSIVEFQTKMETNRDNFYLLEEAVPSNPTIYPALTQIFDAAQESGISVIRMDLREVNLVDTGEATASAKQSSQRSGSQDEDEEGQDKNVPQQYFLTLDAEANNENVEAFMRTLTNQRRLKLYEDISLSPSKNIISSESAQFRVQFTIKGLYL